MNVFVHLFITLLQAVDRLGPGLCGAALIAVRGGGGAGGNPLAKRRLSHGLLRLGQPGALDPQP